MTRCSNSSYYKHKYRNDGNQSENKAYYIKKRVTTDHSNINRHEDYSNLDEINYDAYDDYLANEGYEEYLASQNNYEE